MIYIQLFLLFFYFKLARVYKKEEQMTPWMLLQHLIFIGSSLATLYVAFTTQVWYFVVLAMWLDFIAAALVITAVQIGIFVDGKALFGISTLYKFFPLIYGFFNTDLI